MSPLSVLVVEDDARCLLKITEVLRAMGHMFKRNTTGADVINQVVNFSPDLILMDLHLPEVNAIDICRQLNQDHCTAHIPIVALTDSESTYSLTYFSDALVKPITQETFNAVVAQCLSR